MPPFLLSSNFVYGFGILKIDVFIGGISVGKLRYFFNLLYISSVCVSMSATQITIQKIPQECASGLGQRLIKAIENYDGSITTIIEKDVDRLLKLGADVNVRDAEGNTALMQAVILGQDAIMSKKAALDKDAPHNVMFGFYSKARDILDDRYRVIYYFVDIYKARVDLQNDKGETALMRAIKYGSFDDGTLNGYVDFILNAFISVCWKCLNKQDHEGNSALMMAVEKNNSNIVGRLLQAGPKLYLKNKKGETAFDLAAPYPEINKMLHDFEEEKRAKNVLTVPVAQAQPVSTKKWVRKIKKAQQRQAVAIDKSKLWYEKKEAQEKELEQSMQGEEGLHENMEKNLHIVVQEECATASSVSKE